MAHSTQGAVITADIPPPGSDDEGNIPVTGERSIWVWTSPAHVLTTGWTILAWVRQVAGGKWKPLSNLSYSPTVDITPGDIEEQQLTGTDITEIKIPHSADAYVQLINITGDGHAVQLVVTTEHGLGDLHTPEAPLAHGSLELDTPAATTLGVTAVKLTDTTLAAGSLTDWVATNNRLTYVGVETKTQVVNGLFSAGHSKIATLTFGFALGTLLVPASAATVITASTVGRKVPINDEGAMPLGIPPREYSAGAYIELWAASDNTGDITPTHFAYWAFECVDT